MVPSNVHTADRILDAALSVMESNDSSRFTVKAVSRSAGMSRQTVYRYFDSGLALRNGIVERQDRRFVVGLQKQFLAADSVADAMRDTVRLALDLFRPLKSVRRDRDDSGVATETSTTLLLELFADHAGPTVPTHTVQSAADTFMRLIASYLLSPNGLSDRQISDRITAVVLPALTND